MLAHLYIGLVNQNNNGSIIICVGGWKGKIKNVLTGNVIQTMLQKSCPAFRKIGMNIEKCCLKLNMNERHLGKTAQTKEGQLFMIVECTTVQHKNSSFGQ